MRFDVHVKELQCNLCFNTPLLIIFFIAIYKISIIHKLKSIYSDIFVIDHF